MLQPVVEGRRRRLRGVVEEIVGAGRRLPQLDLGRAPRIGRRRVVSQVRVVVRRGCGGWKRSGEKLRLLSLD